MIRLKAKQQEKKAEDEKNAAAADAEATATGADGADGAAATSEEKPKTVKILGVGRGKRAGASKEKKRTPGEIRIQKGAYELLNRNCAVVECLAVDTDVENIAELDGGQAATVTFPEVNDLTLFDVKISVDTGLWKGATYNFNFKIPPMYPHEPPKVRCLTKIYHPNIDLDGNVCLNILREDWKPVLDINSVIYGLIYLFYEPNPDDPLNRGTEMMHCVYVTLLSNVILNTHSHAAADGTLHLLRAEAAELFRNDPTQFANLVKRSLRGYTVQGIEFEALVS